MNTKKTSGFLLAAATAVLFANGPVTAQEQESEQEAKVNCGGINACKGQSECKTATNACKGQNSCKGKGFLKVTEEECKARGGEVLEGAGM